MPATSVGAAAIVIIFGMAWVKMHPLLKIITAAACDKAKQWQRAVQLLEGMEAAGVKPNEYHFSSAIAACAKCNQTDAAMRLPVSGIYKIKGVGDVIAGRVEQGMVKPGEEVPCFCAFLQACCELCLFVQSEGIETMA